MHNLRQSLWLPAAVLAVGIALTIAMLTAADRAAPADVGPSAYPNPCIFLPIIKQSTSAGSSAAVPYPPPGLCELRIPKRIYLPIVYR